MRSSWNSSWRVRIPEFVLPWADLVVDEEREIVVSPRTWLLEGRDPRPVIAQAWSLGYML